MSHETLVGLVWALLVAVLVAAGWAAVTSGRLRDLSDRIESLSALDLSRSIETRRDMNDRLYALAEHIGVEIVHTAPRTVVRPRPSA